MEYNSKFTIPAVAVLVVSGQQVLLRPKPTQSDGI